MLAFPSGLRPSFGGFAPSAKTIGGGQGLAGFEQVVSGMADRWQATYRFFLNTDERVLIFRAFVMAMRGRANTVNLPAFDNYRAPFGASAAPSPVGVVSTAHFYREWPTLAQTGYRFSGLTDLSGIVTPQSASMVRLEMTAGIPTKGLFLDIAGVKRRLDDIVPINRLAGIYIASVSPQFTLGPSVPVSPVGRLDADVEPNATGVSIAMSAGGAPRPGHMFSIGTRLYSIIDIAGEGPYAATIWPWIRNGMPAGTAVDFVSPSCEMRFATDGEGADALRSLDQLYMGTITLNFDEASSS